jgi:hypothetical protein
MKKNYTALFVSMLLFMAASAQHKTQNLVIVTMDGMRWQEVFGGVDKDILSIKKYSHDSEAIVKKYWSDDIKERRQKLFPFLWGTVAKQGQLYGNRNAGSLVNVANKYWFSYPGYNEIFTGYPDTAVNSNDKIRNNNENVLEFINKQKGYVGKVAAFSTWDCFPYILNKWRSGVYVNADTDSLNFNDASLKLINDMQWLTAKPIDVRPDVLTYFAGREYLKTHQPKVLYIAFDETDDYAHAGMYSQYLKSAHAEDAMLADLWQTIQAMPGYKNNTTLIITCDHGRGDKVKEQWTSHGSNVLGSDQIWIAAIGPDTKPLGEVTNNPQLYQRQFATTFAALLGLQFTPAHPTMPPVETIIK